MIMGEMVDKKLEFKELLFDCSKMPPPKIEKLGTTPVLIKV